MEANEETPAKVEVTEKKPEEAGSRCKVIYTGNKLFWRTQITYDIHIYLHIIPKVIEIIPYEAKRNAECQRIYLNVDTLLSIIGNDIIMEKVNTRKKEAMSERFVKKLPPDSILIEEEQRLAMSSFILSHLKSEDSPTNGVLSTPNIFFDTSLTVDKNPVYDKIPETVTPVFVPRRRHSSEAEIKDKLKEVSEIQKDIRNLSSKAERISNLFSEGMNRLHSLKKNAIYETYSIPRKRWAQAIARVIRINLVAKNKENIRQRFGNKYFYV
jgi:hypothetical protein